MNTKILKILDTTIEYALYIFIFCLPFSKAIVEASSITAVTAFAIRWGMTPKKRKFADLHPLVIPMIIFLLFNAITLFWSVDVGCSVKALFSKVLKVLLLCFAVGHAAQSQKVINRMMLCMFASVLLVSIDGVYQFILGTDFLRQNPLYDHGDVRACFTNPNDFAAWLLFFFPLMFTCFLQSKRIIPFVHQRLVVGGVFLCALFVLMLTDSRAAWLSVCLGMAFFLICYVRHMSLVRKVVILCAFIGCLVAIFYILPAHVQARILSTFDLNDHLKYRISLWKKAWLIIKDHHFLGTGINTYYTITSRYDDYFVRGYITKTMYPHNCYLRMLAEIGIAGFVAFVSILVMFFRAVAQYLRKENAILLGMVAGIVSFLIHSAFDTGLYALQLSALFWFMIGVGIAQVRIYKNDGGCDYA